jgi:multidrug efflux system membrane fusion protein
VAYASVHGRASAFLLLGFMVLAGPAGAQALPPVTVARADRQDVPIFASGVGTVQAYRSVLVRARVDGTLDKIFFKEGQDVKPGDPLAEIDPRPYAASLAEAQAKRAGDQANIDNLRRDLVRYAALARTNFASRQQLDTQQASVNQAVANLAGDDAAIAAAGLNLSFCHITSPIAGVVGLRQVDEGNLVHATDSTGIVTVTQVQPISLVFTLPESEFPKVQAAMRAAVGGALPRVLAYSSEGAATAGGGTDPGRKLATGTLLTPNNSIDTATGTIALKATFDNNDRALWPGQFVSARVQLGVAHNVVSVPEIAVQHGPDGVFVYVVQADNSVLHRNVELGYEGDGQVIVTDGLNGGENVIVAGQVRVQPGVRVDPHPAHAG